MTAECYYCRKIMAYDGHYRPQSADRDIGSPAPRCALHWRYICGSCNRSAHFMSTAYCPDSSEYFCQSCATAIEIITEPFSAWEYYFISKSPWTGRWQPSLDRLEFEGKHPAKKVGPGNEGPGIAREVFLRKPPLTVSQRLCDNTTEMEAANATWGDHNAQHWDATLGANGDEMRLFVTDQAVMRMLGSVSGLDVLDLGCGNGYFCRKLSSLGARVTGADLSDQMILVATAHERDSPLGVRYVTGSATDAGIFGPASFDRIVSSYMLHDLSEYIKVLTASFGWLRPGGKMVLLITHPCFSCGPRTWYSPVPDSPRAEEAAFFGIDNYLRTDSYLMQGWDGFSPVPYFHRPLREYWRAFHAVGFDVQDFDEPSVNEQGRSQLPKWKVASYDRIPLTCVFLLSKPVNCPEKPQADTGSGGLGRENS